ncbi:Solute carrier family 35 member B1 [Schistosoma japonicum]|uniref:Solute carrier family 35 member B1 n=2 Tax=Schistosoma japonicum TaxID=6182 RepID=C1LF09_SCHJA|nr:Solute carrier family 35 member B1 [Schistosoma japonicum]CAX73287.1 Solute carrier family 35 member B1 [Schistosoma japonicum]
MLLVDAYSLLFRSGGVFLSYLVYGIYQEKITKTKYGPGKELFDFYFSLLFFQCVVNFIFSRIALRFCSEPSVSSMEYKFSICGFSYIVAMYTSNTSLKYVTYPTQVIGKSIKPIPVMLLSVLLARRRYPLQKYIFVMMISFGVALFMFSGHSLASFSSQFGIGECLLVCSLLLDGITGGVQEDLKKHNVGPYTLMMHMNLWSIIYLVPGIIISGEALPFVEFIKRHLHILSDMSIFGLTSAIGQMFLFGLITNFSPLTCSIVTTTRKFFTVLFSVALFGNSMTTFQWVGTALIFSGLLLDQVWGKTRSKQSSNSAKNINGTVNSVTS